MCALARRLTTLINSFILILLGFGVWNGAAAITLELNGTNFNRDDIDVTAKVTAALPEGVKIRFDWRAPPTPNDSNGAIYFSIADPGVVLDVDKLYTSTISIRNGAPSAYLGTWSVSAFLSDSEGNYPPEAAASRTFDVDGPYPYAYSYTAGLYGNLDLSNPDVRTDGIFYTEDPIVLLRDKWDYFYYPVEYQVALYRWYYRKEVMYYPSYQVSYNWIREYYGGRIYIHLPPSLYWYGGTFWVPYLRTRRNYYFDVKQHGLHTKPGLWEWEIRVDTGDGSGMQFSKLLPFTLEDNTDPLITVTSPQPTDSAFPEVFYTTVPAIAFSGTVTDNADEVTDATGNSQGIQDAIPWTLTWPDGTTSSGTLTDGDSSSGWSFESPLQLGSHTLSLTATDAAGNSVDKTLTVVYGTEPVLTLIEPHRPVLNADGSYSVTFNISDADSTLGDLHISWGDGLVDLISLDETVQSQTVTLPHTYLVPAGPPEDVTFVWTAYATDSSNYQSNSVSRTVRPNLPPEIIKAYPPVDTVNAEGSAYRLNAEATDINGNLQTLQTDWYGPDWEEDGAAPLETQRIDSTLAVGEETLSQQFSRFYQFETLDTPQTVAWALTARDVQGLEHKVRWVVPVHNPSAQDNDCDGPCWWYEMDRSTGDPVNTASGAQFLSHNLLQVRGNLPLSFKLRYNSLLVNQSGPVGSGWEQSAYGARLQFLPQGDVLVHWSANRYNLFKQSTAGTWHSAHSTGRGDELGLQTDGSYTLTRRNGLRYRFAPDGALSEQGDKQGRFVSVAHDAAGRVSRIVDPLSAGFLAYTYNAAGLLETVTDSLGRQVYLAYDAAKRLTQITDAAGQNTTYTYNAHGQILTGSDHEGRTLFSNTFDAAHRIATQSDGNHHTLSFTYDDDSNPGLRITTVTDSLGGTKKYTARRDDLQLVSVADELGNTVLSYAYDTQGRRIARSDANGNTTRYSYDANGNLSTVTDPAGAVTTLEYDAARNLTRAENDAGHAVTLEYDAANRLVSRTDPAGGITRYTYFDGRLASVTRPRGGVTQYHYTAGRLTGIVAAEGQSYTLGYDAAGRLISLTDAENHTTALEYDGADRVTTLINPLGQSVALTYDSRGNILTLTDANGNVTRREYDHEGNLVRQINALNRETRYQYDSEDRLIAVTDANQNTTQLHYDAAGRLTGLTDALGNTVSLSYDAAGNLLESVDALGNRVRKFNYNTRNQVTQSTDALGHSDSYQYDNLGRLAQDSDPAGNSTAYGYDRLNRLLESLDALSSRSAQTFDADGNRVTLSDPDGHQTRFAFDLSGRLIESRTAADSPMQYTYNARDLITQVTNGRGQNHVYAYDAAGRVITVTTPEGATAYSYDNNGNVLTVSDSSGTISRAYDALDRVTDYSDARGNHIGYAYDAVGNLITLTYPDDKQVHYAYDAVNRLVKVTDWAGRETAYHYDANGRLTETLRPNGTRQTRSYDAKGQLLRQTDTDPAGNVIAQFDFSYDPAGDILAEHSVPVQPPFVPDPLAMTYGAANRLATYNGNAVQFDNDGNMVYGPLGGQMDSFGYDSRNRLVQAGSTVYHYDAENQRIGVDGAAFTVNPQPALSQVLVKTGADGTQTYYVYGLGLVGEESAAGYKAYHFDLRGSTVAMSDEAGGVAERFHYSAYGLLLTGDAAVTPFLFNGMYGVMADGNGLYHMRARFYSPKIRRFLNRDVLLGNVARGQTLNRFAFLESRVTLFIDPLGLEIKFVLNNPDYPFDYSPNDILDLALLQIRQNSAILEIFDSLLANKEMTFEGLVASETEVVEFGILKSHISGFLPFWMYSKGQTRWDGVFKNKWPGQKNKTCMFDLTLYEDAYFSSDDYIMHLSASILVHELAHWIEAFSLGKPHPAHEEFGEYIEGLIDVSLFEPQG